MAVAFVARRAHVLRGEVEMRRATDGERDLGPQQRALGACQRVAEERAERDVHEGRLVVVAGRIGRQRDPRVVAGDFVERFRREWLASVVPPSPSPTIKICVGIVHVLSPVEQEARDRASALQPAPTIDNARIGDSFLLS